jgi:hypothetical protein
MIYWCVALQLHGFVTRQTRGGNARPKKRCGASSVTFPGPRRLFYVPDSGIVAMQMSPFSESLI